jgi:hypothetical protein
MDVAVDELALAHEHAVAVVVVVWSHAASRSACSAADRLENWVTMRGREAGARSPRTRARADRGGRCSGVDR